MSTRTSIGWLAAVVTVVTAVVVTVGCAAPSTVTGSTPTTGTTGSESSTTPSARRATADSSVPVTGPTAAERATCPRKWNGAGTVPEMPRGVSTDQLVPTEPPTSAVLCSYLGTNTDAGAPISVTDVRELTGDLHWVPEALAELPATIKGQEHPCTMMGGAQTSFLLGLDYPNRSRVWVFAAQDPNNCVGTTNGVFDSFTNTGEMFAGVMAAGAPVTTVSGKPCTAPDAGRAGQETGMAPDGATAIEICGDDRRKTTGAITDPAVINELTTALNAQPTVPSTSSCQLPSPSAEPAGKPDAPTSYEIVLRYASGPPVVVRVLVPCDPAIDNGSLQATDATAVVAILDRLLDTLAPTG